METISAELAEQSEAEAMHSLVSLLSAETRRELGVAVTRLGGGVVVAVRNDPSGFWSRAVGLGLTEPVTAALIGQAREFLATHGVGSATVQIAPSALPADWAEIAAKHELTEGALLVKVAARLDAIVPPEPAPELRVAEVTAAQAPRWATVMAEVFGLPGLVLRRVAEASVGRTDLGWHALGSWDGGDLVGTAMLRVHGEVGNMFSGATVPAARGRGGQSALLWARAELARAGGARWLVSETGAEQPGEHNSSLHNMLRAGMAVRYERRNWTLRTGAE
ncbi:hypothetical protein GCM10010452_44670 [Crossiella cryophila]